MPLSLSREELTKILNAKSAYAASKISFTGVEFNSGDIRGGELFVALKGAAKHGHAFLDDAISRGAALALIEDESLLSKHPQADRLVCVPDTLVAFQELARWWRAELNIPVLAITGSVGKTTTKEIAAAVLIQHSRGIYSLKSYNNHTGVPYTILKAGREHQWIVLEMGMNQAGELAVLSKIGAPNIAVITGVGPSHIGNLGSLEAIAAAKLEITQGLAADGLLLLNGGNAPLMEAAKTLTLKAGQRLEYFGDHTPSVAKVLITESHGLEGLSVSVELNGRSKESLKARIDLIGRRNAQNIAGALAGARALLPDLSVELITKGLSQFRAPLMRLNLKALNDGRQLLDDSYNAGPDSMHALLELAEDLKRQKKVVGLVLGDMLELGAFSEAYHHEIAQHVARMAPAFLITVGRAAGAYVTEAKNAGINATQAENPEVAAHLARKLRFDILLVKGSRGIGLDRTVKTLESQP